MHLSHGSLNDASRGVSNWNFSVVYTLLGDWNIGIFFADAAYVRNNNARVFHTQLIYIRVYTREFLDKSSIVSIVNSNIYCNSRASIRE